jgi:shikimate kinase
MMRSQGRKVILVYLKYSEEFLLQRIKNTDRETTILTTSSTWENLLLEKQRQIFEAPTSEEADYFFEITDEDSLQQAKKEILNLL